MRAGLYPPGYGQADYEEDQGVKVWRLRYHTDGLPANNFSSANKLLFRLLKYSLVLQADVLLSVKGFSPYQHDYTGRGH